MAAPTVYDNVADDANVRGQLFAGKKFWVAQRVPLRKSFLDDIKNNGGEVVMLEKHADYMIADHFRRDCPPGSTSYTFVQESLKRGAIEDPDKYPAGPPAGSVPKTKIATGGRAAYTAEEDRVLYKWVRDCEAKGGLSSGNEMYKQLAAKHPRHTWQSWRDRYLKQLRDRPPSAFNIPDNAPPSPDSDGIVTAPAVKTEKKPTAKPEKKPPSKRVVEASKRFVKQHTVDDFDLLFDQDDWEELYANVEEINDCDPEKVTEAWESWAEGGTKTAEQWKQYFEKVILPQWERDPVSKREKVRKAYQLKQQEIASQEDVDEAPPATPKAKGPRDERQQSNSAPTPKAESRRHEREQSISDDWRFDDFVKSRYKGKSPSAYVYFAREKKWTVWNEHPGLDYTNLHKMLMAQWDSLSPEAKTPYLAQAAAERSTTKVDTAPKSPQVCLSSSTAVQETPSYIAEAYNKALKRIHQGGYAEPREEHTETPRPAKRRRSRSPAPRVQASIEAPIGASQIQSREISSNASSTSESHLPREEEEKSVPRGQSMAKPDPAESVDSESDFDDIEALPQPKELGFSVLPSDTPTPRAPRHKAPAFDTQMLLSSPSQDLPIAALPRPKGFTQMMEDVSGEEEEEEYQDEDEEEQEGSQPASTPVPEPPSDASTTQSLHEFRRSLTTAEEISQDVEGTSHPTFLTLAPPALSSPSQTSTHSLDPDEPIQTDEFDDFFAFQHDQGYSDDFITAALKHTCFRPLLAEEVLAAWAEGKPLPDKRGVWSKEDDEDVEGGDATAMARLEGKHSFDRWGGITERLKFLDVYRSR